MSKLRFIALSGTVSVTENLYVYETDDKMLIVDCGVGFPDIEMHGVDLVIPDFSYIVKNKHKLVGVVLSQSTIQLVRRLLELMVQQGQCSETASLSSLLIQAIQIG